MPKTIVSEVKAYPVILHREDNLWGYFSPEFGGGGAPTQTDALRLAQEMIDAAVADMNEAGQTAPEPSELDALDASGGKIVFLRTEVSNASERIFLTIPKTLLHRIDAATSNRSAFFAELARERLGSD